MPRLIDNIPSKRTLVYIEFLTPEGWKHYEAAYTAARARQIVSEAFRKGLTKYPAYRFVPVDESANRQANFNFTKGE